MSSRRKFGLICLFATILMIVLPSTAQEDSLEDCILIIGDSIPAGQAVSRVPGYGFPVIVSEPFSHVLDTYYNELGITHMGIYNLSVGASSLGTGSNVRYFDTPQFDFAITKRCQFVVIFPFINDLPNSTDTTAVNNHIQRLEQLIAALQSNSPQTQVLVLDYYRVVVTELGERVYGNTISPPVIGAMNQNLSAACTPTDLLGARRNVTCFHIEPYLLPLDDVLMRSITQTQFYAEGFYADDGQGQAWLTEFWGNNPNSPIDVDGVHLNSNGKRRLAIAVHNALQTINPSAFQTVAAF